MNEHQRTILVMMASVGSGFWVMLWFGFWVHDQRAPPGINQGALPAAIIFFGTVALGVRAAWRNRESIKDWLTPPDLSDYSISAFKAQAERRKWLAELAADPRRQRYAAMIEAGDSYWTPERIEYDLNPLATTCCEHLAPIESAMRRSGLRIWIDCGGSATADCRVDADALSRRFILPASVSYSEMESYDHSPIAQHDGCVACTDCRSRIWVKHPLTAPPDTPVFPQA